MGYNPTPVEQWTADDLATAEAAKDFAAIDSARRAGHLRDLMNPAAAGTTDAEAPPPLPVGPTVPGQQPGAPGGDGYGSGAPMDRNTLDRLMAAKDYAAINNARRAGHLDNLL